MIANALIAARVTTDTKQRFAAVARRQGLSESTPLKRYVAAALLHASALPPPVVEPVEPVRGDARVCVRLQAGDMLLLRERAAAREMPASTYVSFGRSVVPAPSPSASLDARAGCGIGCPQTRRRRNWSAGSKHQSNRPGGESRRGADRTKAWRIAGHPQSARCISRTPEGLDSGEPHKLEHRI
jgi:hypothetical protein